MRKISFENLKLHFAVVEIRYPKGYRYWDICGKCILEIAEKTGNEWDFQELSGGVECILKCKNNDKASASFGFRHMTLSASHLRNINFLREKGPVLFDIVRGNLGITHYDRIGLRFKYVYATKNTEEAERIVNNLGLFKVEQQRFVGFGDAAEGIMQSVVLSKGDQKVNITIGGATRKESAQPVDEEFEPTNCVLIDIDFHKENVAPGDIDIEKYIYDCQKITKENIETLLNK